MRNFIIGVVCLAMVLTVVPAKATLIDDFNSYTGRQTDAGYFNVDPGYGASGWTDFYTNAGLQDPAIIVDVGGPHPSATRSPSGYQNTLGISNMNGNAPGHGQSFPIPGGAVGPNLTVRLWAHVNLSNNTSDAGDPPDFIAVNSQVFIGHSCRVSACAGDWEANVVLAQLKGGAGGGLGIGTGGGQPSGALDWTTGSSDTDADGWLQVMVEVEIDGNGFMSTGTSYHRPATGGAWIQSASIGAPADTQATHFAIQMSRDVTFDNVTFEIIPEPAALTMLVLGAGLILVRRRRC